MMVVVVHGMVSTSMQIFEITSSYSFILRKKYHYRERTIQYIKDGTECFDDYFPCQKDNCTLEHLRNWFNLFVEVYNSMIIFTK